MSINDDIDAGAKLIYTVSEADRLTEFFKQDVYSAKNVYDKFLVESMQDFERYAGKAFSESPWGEKVFHKHFAYFSDSNTNNTNKFECRLSDDGSLLYVNANNLSLRVNAYRWHNIFVPQVLRVKQKCDAATYKMRKLITAYCLAARTLLSGVCQFTYMGERFILENRALTLTDENTLYAVPFQHAGSLSSIDSIRLIEKIDQCIKRKIEKLDDESASTTIRIAAFGSFSDQPCHKNEKHNIENLADAGYFNGKKKIDLEITYFSPKKFNLGMLWFEENSADSEKRISGNLFTTSFWLSVCKKYDIICLLDMGCFYTDTNRFSDAFGDNPYEAVRGRARSIRYQKQSDGVDSIDIQSYEGLYAAYLKWIEYEFYGKNHSYEFDPKLFAVLKGLESETPIYSFMSHDRGKALSSVMEHYNLCKGEFYNGRTLVVYDWSKSKALSEEYASRRNAELLDESKDDFTSQSLFPIRLWKVIKSLGDDFFRERFTQHILDSSDNYRKNNGGLKLDFNFIKFAKEAYIVLDYSHLKDSKLISFSIEYLSPENESRILTKELVDKYHAIAKDLVMGIMKLAFDPACYEECSSSFCRSIIINAMEADSVGIEHLLLAHLLNRQSLWRAGTRLIFSSQSKLVQKPRPESLELYRAHQSDNLALFEAIRYINNTNYSSFAFAADNLELFLPRLPHSESSTRITGNELLLKMREKCVKLDFTNCTLYDCAIQKR